MRRARMARFEFGVELSYGGERASGGEVTSEGGVGYGESSEGFGYHRWDVGYVCGLSLCSRRFTVRPHGITGLPCGLFREGLFKLHADLFESIAALTMT